MKILFAHPNFPGQFVHLARHATATPGWEAAAITDAGNRRPPMVDTETYAIPARHVATNSRAVASFAEAVVRAEGAAAAALRLRARGFHPDVVLAHGAWGEGIYLKEVFPRAAVVVYAELFRRSAGQNVGFDPEFDDRPPDGFYRCASQNAPMLASLAGADAGLAPTRWQADSFPQALRGSIAVCHDGIDTDAIAPDPGATLTLPSGVVVRAGEPIVTFASRILEPLRGYHRFMRAIPAILDASPEARVLVVGRRGPGYGPAVGGSAGESDPFLDAIRDRIDPSRVHFLGHLSRADFTRLLQVSAAHVHLSWPFVLSWSFLEAMAAGAPIVSADTAPVREFVGDGQGARLVQGLDADGVAAAVTDLLRRPEDAMAMRAAARAIARSRVDLRTVCLPAQVALLESLVARVRDA